MDQEAFEAALRHQVLGHLKLLDGAEVGDFLKASAALFGLMKLNIDPRIWRVITPLFLEFHVKEIKWQVPEPLQTSSPT